VHICIGQFELVCWIICEIIIELVRLYLACVEIVYNIIIFISNCLLRIKIRNYFLFLEYVISSGLYLEQLLILNYHQRLMPSLEPDNFCSSA
jgi:hypothetical protein